MAVKALALSLFIGLSVAGYTLEDDYLAGGNFFEKFSFFTGKDPTHGFVDYVDQATAQNKGFIKSSASNVHIGTDHTNKTPNGRPSVRLVSNKSYDSGLIILDLDHMPGGVCGTWPAFWTLGPNWPNNGEIDIIEGINDQVANDMTLHTSDNCTIADNGGFSGALVSNNCFTHASGQPDNEGCSIHAADTHTYGAGFNANKGGVYAAEFDSAVKVWFFQCGSVPADITSGNPKPAGWGEPMALFQGDCDFPQKIKEQQIVFDLTYCGDWAGNAWNTTGSCGSKAKTCNDFVANNPAAFADMYWSINSLTVYQNYGYM